MDIMPRRSRTDGPGALNHIMFRGIERRKIFLITERVCSMTDFGPSEELRNWKARRLVATRSLLCFWGGQKPWHQHEGPLKEIETFIVGVCLGMVKKNIQRFKL